MSYAIGQRVRPWSVFAGLMAGAVVVLVVLHGVMGREAMVRAIPLVLAVWGAASAVWRWVKQRSLPAVSTPAQLDDALEALAETLESQWRAEAARRGVAAPEPARVTWEMTRRPVTDRAWAIMGDKALPESGTVQEIHELFAEVPRRRLVIIGAAGTGKTTAAIQLLLDSLARRAEGDRALTLVALSTWDPHSTHLVDFVARQLDRDHPYLGNPQYGASASLSLVTSGRVIPILDGLEEISEARRAAAVAALNQSGISSLILTSRADEYQQATRGQVVAGAAVIELRPVDVEAAIAFLSEGCSPQVLREWEPVFAVMRTDPESPARRCLETPLMLSLARQVYLGRSPTELLDESRFSSPVDVEDHLLDALIPVLYADQPQRVDVAAGRRGRRYRGECVGQWLGYLACRARQRQTYDLAWWRLPLLLPWPRRASASMILFALISMVLTVVIMHNSKLFGLSLAAVPSIAYSIARRRNRDDPPTQLGWAFGWAHLRYTFANLLLAGFRTFAIVVLVLQLTFVFVESPAKLSEIDDFSTHLGMGVIVGLAVGLVAAVGAGFSRAAPTAVLSPGRSFRAHFGFIVVARMLPAVVVSSLVYIASVSNSRTRFDAHDVISVISVGLLVATAFSIMDLGGQYLVSIVLLAGSGKLPWHLLCFLNDANYRGVFRQQGATYQFRHARLQDRLAARYIYSKECSVPPSRWPPSLTHSCLR